MATLDDGLSGGFSDTSNMSDVMDPEWFPQSLVTREEEVLMLSYF